MVSETINFAVVGAGYWGTKLVGEYLELSRTRKEVELREIADISPVKLSKIANKWHIPSSMLKEDYNDLLHDPKIDGVHIATPNATHYEIARKAIEAGKHVLLEKPMCLSAGEAFKLARCAEKVNSILLIGHIFRFNAAINKVKEMIDNKEIDEVRCVELRWTALLPPPPGRDIIFDLAPHPVDILNHLFEEWPTRVYVDAKSYERKKAGLEEIAFATLEFPRDILVELTLSWLHHGPRERTIRIISKENTMNVEAVKQRITLYEKDRREQIPIKPNNTIESEIMHFMERIKKNDPPINSALTGAVNVTVLEAMRKSLQEGKVSPVIGG